MLSSITNDPVSSWGYQSENTTNASGVTFNVKFMGYVPVNNSISNLSTSEKDALVKLCVTTVVTCDLTDQFKDALREESLGPYISVAELEVFLNVANFTITFFHKEDGTFLLGRYMNNTTSYYKTVIIDGEHYLGLVMGIRSPRTQRECNVIKLGSKKAHDELIEKLKSVHNEERCPVSKLESRLVSELQNFEYQRPMGKSTLTLMTPLRKVSKTKEN
uniref:Uncharacterized protein n=1 Tax=Caenorhabditis japonica TaxID=281687 RepID=A0A8R1DI29_CAEJA